MRKNYQTKKIVNKAKKSPNEVLKVKKIIMKLFTQKNHYFYLLIII